MIGAVGSAVGRVGRRFGWQFDDEVGGRRMSWMVGWLDGRVVGRLEVGWR